MMPIGSPVVKTSDLRSSSQLAPAVETRTRRLRAIRKRCARLLKAGGPSAVEHGDLLYDENGLPN